MYLEKREIITLSLKKNREIESRIRVNQFLE